MTPLHYRRLPPAPRRACIAFACLTSLPLALSACTTVNKAFTISPADPALQQVVILRELEHRQVALSDNARKYASPGEEFYICAYDTNRIDLKTINDAHTAKPLKARIRHSLLGEPTALVLGLRPLGVNLQGAVLSRQLPEVLRRQRLADAADPPPKNHPDPTG